MSAVKSGASSEEHHPDDKKLSGRDFTRLRDRKRATTDSFCLLLLGGCWIAMTIIGFIVLGWIDSEHLNPGNPARLTNALDYDGRICGYSDGVRNKPNAYYMINAAVVCVKRCPGSTDYTNFICFDEYQEAADSSPDNAWTFVSERVCMYQASTYEFLNRCWYDNADESNRTASDVAAEYIDTSEFPVPDKYKDGDSAEYSTGFFADLYSMRGYIFGFGLGIGLVFSFAYLYFLRIPGLLFTLIWTMLISVFVVLLMGSVLVYTKAQRWENNENRQRSEWMTLRVLSIIGFILTGLYVCLLLVLRKRIMLAIGVVKEASRALAAMPMLIMMPLIQSSGILIFLVPWVAYTIYLASSGEIKSEKTTVNDQEVSYKSIEYDDNTRLAFLYLLFCWFWTSEFILAVGEMVTALSIAGWYFSRNKKNEGNCTVVWAFKTAFSYHLGTAAYGSLVIAIVKTIRAVLTYLQKKAKKTENQILLYLLSCLQCCMWCLEKFMKFVNKNAYIQTAIHGYSFCKACRTAFFLIARNILRVACVSIVGDFVLFLGKALVPLSTTFLCYVVLAYDKGDNVYGLFGPLFICFMLSFMVVCMFSEIFGMTISTVLICFIADEEMFPPAERYAYSELTGTMKKSQQAAKVAQIAPEEEKHTVNKKENSLL